MHVEGEPGWELDIRERSAGVYVVTATHEGGQTLQRTGSDVDVLLGELRSDIWQTGRERRERRGRPADHD